MINLNKGDIVSFQLKANNIVGGTREAMKVEAASVSYSVASVMDPELHVKHTALYPYFKDTQGYDNVDNPANYDYVILKGDNGVMEVIGEPWINEVTLKIIQTMTCNITIQNYQTKFRTPIERFLSELGASYTLNVIEN